MTFAEDGESKRNPPQQRSLNGLASGVPSAAWLRRVRGLTSLSVSGVFLRSSPHDFVIGNPRPSPSIVTCIAEDYRRKIKGFSIKNHPFPKFIADRNGYMRIPTIARTRPVSSLAWVTQVCRGASPLITPIRLSAQEIQMPGMHRFATQCEQDRINRLRNSVILLYAAAIVLIVTFASLQGSDQDRRHMADVKAANAAASGNAEWRSFAPWQAAVRGRAKTVSAATPAE
jgi:hypothetical protein